MNNLSWILFLADWLHSFTTGLVILLLIAWGFWVYLLGYMLFSENYKLLKYLKYSLFGLILVMFVAGAIPSKTTIYAIAVSEGMESLSKTPLAAKSVKALEVWLDAQINKSK